MPQLFQEYADRRATFAQRVSLRRAQAQTAQEVLPKRYVFLRRLFAKQFRSIYRYIDVILSGEVEK